MFNDNDTISTGLHDLDRILGRGMRPSQLLIVAGASQSGMTTFLDTVIGAAIRDKVQSALIDTESSTTHRMERLAAGLARVNLLAIQSNKLDDSARERVESARDQIEAAPLRIGNEGLIGDISYEVEFGGAGSDNRLIAVDGMRFLREVRDVPGPDRDHAAAILLKRLAVAHNATVVATCPLPYLGAIPPSLGNVSRGVAETADTVLLLHRIGVVLAEGDDNGEAEIILAKNRAGETGSVTVAAMVRQARFVSLASE